MKTIFNGRWWKYASTVTGTLWDLDFATTPDFVVAETARGQVSSIEVTHQNPSLPQ